MQPNELILASASPRRKLLLSQMGLQFSVQLSSAEENDSPDLDPVDLVTDNAEIKAESVAIDFPHALVIGSDTTVSLNGKIFAKPQDRSEATQMLMELSGQWHSVYTAIALHWRGGSFKKSTYAVSQVQFKALSLEEIEAYHEIVNPMDKAGAYGIQEASERIVRAVRGSKDTIMGLPTDLLALELDKYGFKAFYQ